MRATVLVPAEARHPRSAGSGGRGLAPWLEHVGDARVGRLVDLELDSTDAAAQAEVERMCEQLLANPLIESYEIELEGASWASHESPSSPSRLERRPRRTARSPDARRGGSRVARRRASSRRGWGRHRRPPYGDTSGAAPSPFLRRCEPSPSSPRTAVHVLGICNGFQILCEEAGLLPGAAAGQRRSRSFVVMSISGSSARTPFGALRAGQTLTVPIKHGEGCWFADDGLLGELETSGQIVLRYEDNPNGSVADVAGVVNAERNVMGLMPHPEHAVDPLLGSTDGALILGGLVQAARDRSVVGVGVWAGSPPQQTRGAAASEGRSPRRSRSLSRSAPRSVTGPRRAVPSVVYAKRTGQSPLSSSNRLDDGGEAFPAGPLRQSDLLQQLGGTPGGRDLGHGHDASPENRVGG